MKESVAAAPSKWEWKTARAWIPTRVADHLGNVRLIWLRQFERLTLVERQYYWRHRSFYQRLPGAKNALLFQESEDLRERYA